MIPLPIMFKLIPFYCDPKPVAGSRAVQKIHPNLLFQREKIAPVKEESERGSFPFVSKNARVF